MANRKKGSMTSIIRNVAALWGRLPFVRKKSGTPTSAAAPKHISCRLVSPNITLVFTLVKSFGTGTYAMKYLLSARLRAVSVR